MRGHQRCVCGELHVVEIPGESGGGISFHRLHDLKEIEGCPGCGRSFAEMQDELERQGDPMWDEIEAEGMYGIGCGGIR